MNSLRNCMRIILRNQHYIFPNYTALRHFRRTLRPTLIELTKRKEKYAKYQPAVIRSNFLEWNRNAELHAFNARLSEKFDLNLLDQAFVHKSYTEQEKTKRKELGIEDPKLDIEDNSEFVKEGRSILPKIIANYLSQALPLAPRECIQAFVDYLLNREYLAYVSSGIGTKDLILCSKHPVPTETLEDTFYALVSALIRSSDVSHASEFVRDILIATLAEKDLTEIWCPENPFELLCQIFKRDDKSLPEPRLVAQSGVNTLLAVHQVAIYYNQSFIGIGVGNTIKDAQDMAAINSLLRLFRLMDYDQPVKYNMNVNIELEQPIPNLSLNEWSLKKFEV